jgi:hypothetical protein
LKIKHARHSENARRCWRSNGWHFWTGIFCIDKYIVSFLLCFPCSMHLCFPGVCHNHYLEQYFLWSLAMNNW